MIERVDAALRKAFGRRRGNVLAWTLQQHLWRVPHDALLAEPHCNFCGAAGVQLLGGRICERCFVAARERHRAVYRHRRVPDPEMAVTEVLRALRDDGEAAAWLEGRLARIGPPGDCASCGPKSPWPRDARPDERCILCGHGGNDPRDQFIELIVGPGRSLCALCAQQRWPGSRRRR